MLEWIKKRLLAIRKIIVKVPALDFILSLGSLSPRYAAQINKSGKSGFNTSHWTFSWTYEYTKKLVNTQ
jgi:hypothetical protein